MENKRRKYRLAMLEDTTLREVFHFRVSLISGISIITIFFIALIVLLSVLIVYTPIRNILPGYSASLRQQLIEESARVDSLQNSLTIQRQYLDVIKQLTAGDITTENVQSLDSMQIVERAKILEMNNEATDAFLSQYELKERERLLLYDNITNRDVRQLYRPVRGIVAHTADPDARDYTTAIRTAKNENVLATTRGVIVAVEHLADNTWAMTLQTGEFITCYRHISKAIKVKGANVEKGESIGLMDGKHDLHIELWDAGRFVNPAEVIVW